MTNPAAAAQVAAAAKVPGAVARVGPGDKAANALRKARKAPTLKT